MFRRSLRSFAFTVILLPFALGCAKVTSGTGSLRFAMQEPGSEARHAAGTNTYTVTQASLYCQDGTRYPITASVNPLSVPAKSVRCDVDLNQFQANGKTLVPQSPGCALAGVGTSCPFWDGMSTASSILVTVMQQPLVSGILAGTSYAVVFVASTSTNLTASIGSSVKLSSISVTIVDGTPVQPEQNITGVTFDTYNSQIRLTVGATSGTIDSATSIQVTDALIGTSIYNGTFGGLSATPNGGGFDVTVPNPSNNTDALTIVLTDPKGTKITYDVTAPDGGSASEYIAALQAMQSQVAQQAATGDANAMQLQGAIAQTLQQGLPSSPIAACNSNICIPGAPGVNYWCKVNGCNNGCRQPPGSFAGLCY